MRAARPRAAAAANLTEDELRARAGRELPPAPARTEAEGEFEQLTSTAGKDAELAAGLPSLKQECAAAATAARKARELEHALPSAVKTARTLSAAVVESWAAQASELKETEASNRAARAEAWLDVVRGAQSQADRLGDRLKLVDGCPGCASTAALFTGDGIVAAEAVLATAKGDVAQARLNRACASILEAQQAEARLRGAADSRQAAEAAQARIGRLAALNTERAGLALHEAARADRAYWSEVGDAVRQLEAATFWHRHDAEQWAQHGRDLAAARGDADRRSSLERDRADAQNRHQASTAAENAAQRASSIASIEKLEKEAQRGAALVATVRLAERLAEARRCAAQQQAYREAVLQLTEAEATHAEVLKRRNESETVHTSLQKRHGEAVGRASSAQMLAARLGEQLTVEESRALAEAKASATAGELEAYRLVLKPKGGIADKLLGRARAEVERAINGMLAGMGAQFRVLLTEGYELELPPAVAGQDTLPITLASGWQQFVLSLACRTALWQLAQVPLPDCQIIDEGFACCDDDHLVAAIETLEMAVSARETPRLFFVVSHLEQIKLRLECPLPITVAPGGSLVCNGAAVAPPPRPAAPAALVASAASAASAPSGAEEREPTQLPPDPDKPGNVWCAVCSQSLISGRGVRHLGTAKHAAATTRALAKRAGALKKGGTA